MPISKDVKYIGASVEDFNIHHQYLFFEAKWYNKLYKSYKSYYITSDLEKYADTITYIKNVELFLSAKKDDFIRYYTKETGGAPTLEDIMVYIEREEVNL